MFLIRVVLVLFVVSGFNEFLCFYRVFLLDRCMLECYCIWVFVLFFVMCLGD